MRYTKYIVMSVVTLLALGCSDSDDNNSYSVTTADAYYVDSAIEGVDYKCGSQGGVTLANGKFTFEEGSSCSFSLAGIKLREVSKDELQEGKKIVEDNLQVAQLLQSLDIDGNPDNGIKITPEVTQALNMAVKDYNDTTKVLTDENIKEAVIAEVASEVPSFKGELKSIDKVKEHLEKTKTQLTKELLANKSFYVYWNEDGKKGVSKVTINEEANSWEYQDILGGNDSGTESLEIKGDTLIIKHQESEDTDSYRVKEEGKYITLTNLNDNSTLKLYYNKADAEAQYNKASDDTKKDNLDIKALLKDKTLYLTKVNESDIFIDKVTFDSNLSMVTLTEIEGDEKGETTTIKMHITDNKIFFDDTKENKYFKITKANDDYYLMQEYNSDGKAHGEAARLYLDENKAKEYFNSLTEEVTFSGKVVFKRDQAPIEVPQNAKISIRPAEDKWEPNVNIAIDSDGNFSKDLRVPKDIFNDKFYVVIYGDTNKNNNWDGDSGETNNDGVVENDVKYYEGELTFDDLGSIEVNLSSN